MGHLEDRHAESSVGEDALVSSIAKATPVELERLAELLPDEPATVIISSQVRRGAARAWMAGDAADPIAVAFDGELSPGDLHCIGTADGVLELAEGIDGWHSIAVEPRLASELQPALSAKHPTLHTFDDVHHVLRRPPVARPHRDVRLATSDRYGDVGVGVDDAYRRRGLAAAAAAIVCTQVRAADRTPVWSTGNDNNASLRTAAALGFEATDGLVILSRFVGQPSV